MRIREFEMIHDIERAENDEFLFNRARIFTIATYQVRFITDYLACILIDFSTTAHHVYTVVAIVFGN